MKRLLFIAWLMPGLAFATPVVSSFTGTKSDGQTVTISWSGMPAAGPTIAVFDNFEAGTVPVAIPTGTLSNATIGKWDVLFGAGSLSPRPYFASTSAVSGTQCMQANLHCAACTDGGFGLTRNLGNATEFFASFWLQVPLNDACWPGGHDGFALGGSPNWKFAWFWDGAISPSSFITIPNILGPTRAANNGGMTIGSDEGNGSFVPNWACYWFNLGIVSPAGNVLQTSGTWTHYMYQVKAPSTCGGTDGLTRLWIQKNGTNPALVATYTALTTSTYSSSHIAALALSPYGRAAGYGTYQSHPSMDDAYISTGTNGSSLAHAFISDSANWLTSTKTSDLTHVDGTWGSGGANFVFRKGMFNDGDTAYLILMDSSGNTSTGYPFTVASSGDAGAGGGPGIQGSRSGANTVRSPLGKSGFKVRSR